MARLPTGGGAAYATQHGAVRRVLNNYDYAYRTGRDIPTAEELVTKLRQVVGRGADRGIGFRAGRPSPEDTHAWAVARGDLVGAA